MSEIAPSILAADFNRLGEQIKEVALAGIKILHIDVMDGMFVPAISFGMPLIESIRKESNLFFDVHLMINEPIRYVEKFVKVGADGITVHKEACSNLQETLLAVKKLGVSPSVSINPETPVQDIKDVLEMVNMVLVMSVSPGSGGQPFNYSSLDKVKMLKDIREKYGLNYKIEIDGGVNRDNIAGIVKSGVDILVSGTAVFSGNISKNIKSLNDIITRG